MMPFSGDAILKRGLKYGITTAYVVSPTSPTITLNFIFVIHEPAIADIALTMGCVRMREVMIERAHLEQAELDPMVFVPLDMMLMKAIREAWEKQRDNDEDEFIS